MQRNSARRFATSRLLLAGSPARVLAAGLVLAACGGGTADPPPPVQHLFSVVGTGGTGNGTVSGSGINCTMTSGAASGGCQFTYVQGTQVALSATPQSGHTFDGWSGPCSGTAATCSLTIQQAQTLTARFLAPVVTHVVSVLAVPAAGGTVTGGGSYQEGQAATVTATPAAGYTFQAWTEGPTTVATTASHTFTVTAPRTLAAVFQPATAALTVASGGGTGSGTVTGTGISCAIAGATAGATGCSAMPATGATITLTAAPSAGHAFAGWGGACTGTSTTCAVTMTGAQTVTASFTAPVAPTTWQLFVNAAGSGGGVVTSQPAGVSCTISAGTPSGACSPAFAVGTQVTLTASVQIGHVFNGWSGPCAGTGTCVVTMSEARSVTATFTAPVPVVTHTLTVTATGNGRGTITSSPAGISCTIENATTSGSCSAAFPQGTSVTLTHAANTAAGSLFNNWLNDCGGTGSCMVDMTQPRLVTARFAVPTLAALNTQLFGAAAYQCQNCHFGGSPTPLDGTAAIYNTLVGRATTTRTNFPLATTYPTRVVAGNAAQSYLVYQLRRSTGAFHMPTNPAAAVPENLIVLVERWINGGARQNQ